MLFVAQRGFFHERELISKEGSGSTIDLEEIYDSFDEATIEATSSQHENETIEPNNNLLPLRRSSRVSMPPSFYSFCIIVEEDTFISDGTLVNLNEPTT